MRKQTKIKRTRRFRKKKGTRRRKNMKGGAVLETQNGHQNAMIKTYGLQDKTIEFIDSKGTVNKVSIYPNPHTFGTFNIVDDNNISAWTFLQYLQMPNYFNDNNSRIVGMAPPINFSPAQHTDFNRNFFRKY
jgi:hypothetical protein